MRIFVVLVLVTLVIALADLRSIGLAQWEEPPQISPELYELLGVPTVVVAPDSNVEPAPTPLEGEESPE